MKKKLINFKEVVTEMYPWILWEPTLGTTAVGCFFLLDRKAPAKDQSDALPASRLILHVGEA